MMDNVRTTHISVYTFHIRIEAWAALLELVCSLADKKDKIYRLISSSEHLCGYTFHFPIVVDVGWNYWNAAIA
jgi:hypothetical protein